MEAPTIASLDTAAIQPYASFATLLPVNATLAKSIDAAVSVDQAMAVLAATPGVLTFAGEFSSFKKTVQVCSLIVMITATMLSDAAELQEHVHLGSELLRMIVFLQVKIWPLINQDYAAVLSIFVPGVGCAGLLRFNMSIVSSSTVDNVTTAMDTTLITFNPLVREPKRMLSALHWQE